MPGDEELSSGSDDAEESSTSELAYDIETYRRALEEARRTWDQQLDAFNDVAEKAWRVVRLNGLVATVYIAAIANAPPNISISTSTGLIIGSGLFLLAISTYLAVNGQQAQRVSVGQGTEAFTAVRKHDPAEIVYLYETLKDYEDGIEGVAEKTEQNGDTVNQAKFVFLIGVGFITAGTLLGLIV